METKRRYSSEFRALVAIEATKNQMTIQELADKYGLLPSVISRWKNKFLANMSCIFEDRDKEDMQLIRRLRYQITLLQKDCEFLTKKIAEECNLTCRRKMVDTKVFRPNQTRQCELLSIHQSGLYYKSKKNSPEQIKIMNAVDEINLKHPFYGTRRLQVSLKEQGLRVGRKRLTNLIKRKNIRIRYLSISDRKLKYPYLLKDLVIESPNQVWQTDFTYIRIKHRFIYLMAIIDMKTRYVLNWRISYSRDTRWCCELLEDAIEMYGAPKICNTDRGTQFTSISFIRILKKNNIQISMIDKGKPTDNAIIERLWRSVKQENIYPNAYETDSELQQGLSDYFMFYNTKRPHQSIGYKYPEQTYKQALKVKF